MGDHWLVRLRDGYAYMIAIISRLRDDWKQDFNWGKAVRLQSMICADAYEQSLGGEAKDGLVDFSHVKEYHDKDVPVLENTMKFKNEIEGKNIGK